MITLGHDPMLPRATSVVIVLIICVAINFIAREFFYYGALSAGVDPVRVACARRLDEVPVQCAQLQPAAPPTIQERRK